jgi:hypothetical protein
MRSFHQETRSPGMFPERNRQIRFTGSSLPNQGRQQLQYERNRSYIDPASTIGLETVEVVPLLCNEWAKKSMEDRNRVGFRRMPGTRSLHKGPCK